MQRIDRNIKRVLEALKTILTPDPFDNYNAETLENALIDSGCDCQVSYGATKACIIPRDSLLVIKIPFNRNIDTDLYYSEQSEFEDRGEEMPYSVEEYAHDLECATCKALDDEDYHWDYCRLETLIYKAAVSEGLSRFFAQECYYGEINDHPIYLQDRAMPIWDAVERSNEESKRRSQIFCEQHQIYCFDEAWIADFIAYYGEEEFLKLSEFINKYDIDDLRRDNIGYIGFCPVLFDYSGFREW